MRFKRDIETSRDFIGDLLRFRYGRLVWETTGAHGCAPGFCETAATPYGHEGWISRNRPEIRQKCPMPAAKFSEICRYNATRRFGYFKPSSVSS